jgi:hypothetical protein
MVVAMRNRRDPNLRLKSGVDKRNDKTVTVPPLFSLQSILLIEVPVCSSPLTQTCADRDSASVRYTSLNEPEWAQPGPIRG